MKNNYKVLLGAAVAVALAAGAGSAFAGTDSVLTYNAKGQLSQAVLPQGQTHQYGYDQVGLVSSHVMPNPSSAGAGASVIYARDSRGVLTSLTDPRALSTGYSVSGLGDVEDQSSPDTGTTTYVFNEAGQVVSRTNAKGLASFAYDAAGRPTSLDYGDETVSLTYDTAANGAGLPATMHDSSGSTAWAYDTKGNVTSRTQVTTGPGGAAGASLTLQQVFSGGRLTQQTYPSGRVVTYTYDGKNVASIAVDGVTAISNVKYQPFGAPVSWQMGSTGTYSRTFNTLGQMTAYTFEGGLRILVWDESNRIASIANPDGTTWTYGYNNLDRVVTTTEGAQGTRAYSMDATGNRGSVTLNGALYSNAVESSSNRLGSATAPGSVSNFSYNGVGETLGDGARTYNWNNAGYLTQATGSSGAATYRYNGAGQRVAKTLSNGGARHYLYGDDGVSLLGEYAQASAGAAASPVTEIVYLEGTPVLAIKGTVTYFIQADHLNAPRLVKSSAGAASWRWRSDAYGVGAADENPSGAGMFEFNARFPGQQFDGETGLYYNNARYYDPTVGRYISSDPVGLQGGVNTYAYGLQSPVVYTDPSGKIVPLIVAVGLRVTAVTLMNAPRLNAIGIAVAEIGGGVSMAVPATRAVSAIAATGVLSQAYGGGVRACAAISKGGAHGAVRKVIAGLGDFWESHHMPSAAISGKSYTKSPAIALEKLDHQRTLSWGSKAPAQAYAEQQEALVRAGKFNEAMINDIVDIRTKFLTKYDESIDEMIEYAKKSGY